MSCHPSSAVLRTQNISSEGDQDYVTTISAADYENEFPEMSIQISPQLMNTFATGDDRGMIRVMSFLYHNVKDLFPSGRPGENE